MRKRFGVSIQLCAFIAIAILGRISVASADTVSWQFDIEPVSGASPAGFSGFVDVTFDSTNYQISPEILTYGSNTTAFLEQWNITSISGEYDGAPLFNSLAAGPHVSSNVVSISQTRGQQGLYQDRVGFNANLTNGSELYLDLISIAPLGLLPSFAPTGVPTPAGDLTGLLSGDDTPFYISLADGSSQGQNTYISSWTVTPVPEPSSAWLFLMGLGGVSAIWRKKSTI